MKIKARLFTKFKNEEEGFTLLEAVASLLIVSFILLGLTMTMLSGYKTLRDSRLYQQATNLGNKEIETARAVPYDNLAMVSTDPTLDTDPRLLSTCTGHPAGQKYFDPDPASTTIKCEPIVVSGEGGAVSEHITTKTVGPTTFTVKRYVTWVDATAQGGTGQNYKRYTTLVEWARGDETGEYATSTLITRSQRGLPVPKFQVTPNSQTRGVQPGNQVVFPHTIRNLGINDTYDVKLTPPLGRSWTISYYKDTDQDGTYDVGTDTLLFDSNATGKPDTGNLLTNDTFYFLAVFTVGAGEADGNEAMSMQVDSGIDPTVTKVVTDNLRIGDSSQLLYLHHNPSPPIADTTAQNDIAMDLDEPTATTLFKYSTNYSNNQTGRRVEKINSGQNTSDKKKYVNWVNQMSGDSEFNGTAVLEIWVAVKDWKCDKQVEVWAYLNDKADATSSSGTEIGSGSAVLPEGGGAEPCNYRKLTINIPMNNVTILNNRWIELKVVVHDDVPDDEHGQFAYDTTTYTSTLLLPQVFD